MPLSPRPSPAGIVGGMGHRFRISLRRLLAAITVAAIGSSIVAIPPPLNMSGAARDALSFMQMGTGFLTPVVVLSMVFGRPLLWLAIAVITLVIACLAVDIPHS